MLTIDNACHEVQAFGFIGLQYQSKGRIRPLDWSTQEELCGIGLSNHWAMAAFSQEHRVYTIRDNNIAENVETGEKVVHNGGQEGGILFVVPPGKKETLSIAFGFYHEGNATQVIQGKYLFSEYFSNPEEVCKYILHNGDRIRKDCIGYNDQTREKCRDNEKYQIFSQALRGYYANTQLIKSREEIYFNVSEGQYLWRNTLDLSADHIPFELWKNPWVVRNIMDLFIDRYSYEDTLSFFEAGDKTYPGGLSFTHDMGNFTTYTPEGMGGYEKSNSHSYSFMTTEELLNGIYCIVGYGIVSQDMEWIQKRKSTVSKLLESMEKRDHYASDKRDGILKGKSSKC